MSSTDGPPEVAGDPAAVLIRDFFDDELVPAARRLQQANNPLFPLGADASQSTYYAAREKTSMTPEDFVVFGPDSLEDLPDALAQLWGGQGAAELAALAVTLGRVAQAVHRVEDQRAEVSPFMYVMF